MKEHIEISLEWTGKQVDLAVPGTVNAERLVELLSQAFKANKQELPEKWSFIVKGKSMPLDSGLTLQELGLGNGDMLQLMTGEKGK